MKEAEDKPRKGLRPGNPSLRNGSRPSEQQPKQASDQKRFDDRRIKNVCVLFTKNLTHPLNVFQFKIFFLFTKLVTYGLPFLTSF